MSRHASELCALVVGDTYGELTSLLLRILLRHGRLSLPALRHHTCLSERLIKHGLSVLVQHQLVYWYTSENGVTSYEANPDAAYTLLRSGKFVEIAENRISNFAGEVVSNLLALGHARVGDLVQAYGVGNGKSNMEPTTISGALDKSQPNGTTQKMCRLRGHNVTSESVYGTLRELLRFGLICLVNASHFRSDADNRTEAEKVVHPVETYKAKSKRESEAQWEKAVEKKLAEWKHGSSEAETNDMNGVNRATKRSYEDSAEIAPKKRRRLQAPVNGHENGTTGAAREFDNTDTAVLNDDTILRINHPKFAVIMRNDRLVEIANQSICASTSRIYAEVLLTMEPEISLCKDENAMTEESETEPDLTSLPSVTTDKLVIAVKDTSLMASALATVPSSKIDLTQYEHRKKRRRKEVKDENMVTVDEDDDSDEDESESNTENNSVISSDSDEGKAEADYRPEPVTVLHKDSHRQTVRDHLLLLAQHPHKFLHHVPQTSMLPERWTVDFAALTKTITHLILMQIITSRYGILAARLTRILSEQGKVGEKELCQLSLMNQKTMRSNVSTLYKAGMISLQEVPRDFSRNPQRTMFLWFFDYERCKAKMLEETCKSMARSLQRAQVEGGKVKGTVEKASRSDVIGKEEQFLAVQEREALQKWRAVEERLWGEVGRLDDLIAVIRDF